MRADSLDYAAMLEEKPNWSLPYATPDIDGVTRIGKLRVPNRVLRIVAYTALGLTLLVPVIQLQVRVMDDLADVDAWHADREAGALSKAEHRAGPPTDSTGAMNRWASHIRAFWRGKNIYAEPGAFADSPQAGQSDDPWDRGGVRHPNMPFVVILLTPFAFLPESIAALTFTVVKLLLAIAGGLAAIRFCNHRDHRMSDWVVGLAMASWILLAISDIQHANTNLFVLAFIGLHLGFYRQGKDIAAGASLAVAICIKITPLLFVVYWLAQRSWKLLIATTVAGLIFAIVVPAATLGPARYVDLTQTWLDNLIFKGVKGSWYPVHVNQSVPGTVGRYLLDGQAGGDYNYSPDDYGAWEDMPAHRPPRWIAFASLDETTVKWIIRGLQLGVLGLMAAAIGWRTLPRDDGRRGLHVAMVLATMLLVNQRTWDHHAVILLPAYLAIWYALAYGRIKRRWRVTALTLTILAGATLWLSAGELLEGLGHAFGAEDEEEFANHLLAYGPRMYTWLLTFLAAAVCCFALKGKTDPYAQTRQPVGGRQEKT